MSIHMSVRLYVHLSVRQTHDKMKETSVHILIPYERSFHLVCNTRMVVGGYPLLPDILG